MTPIPLTSHQHERLRAYESALRTVNRNVALLSRGELGCLWERHIVHSLMFAIRTVPRGAVVADWGTGGGLPAIPLGIVWPQARILAIDSNAKKTRSVAHFCRTLSLDNCQSIHVRAEALAKDIHYSVSRATAPLAVLWAWHRARVVQLLPSPSTDTEDADALTSPDASLNAGSGPCPSADETVWAQGLLCLKGGDLTQEVETLLEAFPALELTRFQVSAYLDDPYFSGKELIHVREPHGQSR